MKKSYLAAAACTALTVFTAGCSPEWITGGAPDVPPGTYIEDPETVAAPLELSTDGFIPAPDNGIELVPGATVTEAEVLTIAAPVKDEGIPMTPDIRYTVQKNDTLSGIAKVYGAKTKALAQYNGLNDKSIIVPGQVLLIPADMVSVKDAKPADAVVYTPPAKKAAPEKKAAAPAEKTEIKKTDLKPVAEQKSKQTVHVVKSGDILGRLALAYGVKAADIAAANGIKLNSTLRIGQKLVIPNPKKVPAKAAAAKTEKKAAPVKSAKTEKKAAPAKTAQPEKKAAPAQNAGSESDQLLDQLTNSAEKKETPKDVVVGSEEDLFNTGKEDTVQPAAAEKTAAPQAQTKPAETSAPIDTFTFTLVSESSLAETAELMKCSQEDILKLNPKYGLNDRLKAHTEVVLPTLPEY